jgi:2-hydroxy-3-keto-5-methylthiopentenyl-1-phosphate phosphatase
MWDVLSADFDQTITKERCLKNVVSNIKPGSIIVFHDSVKIQNLEYTLPRVLDYIDKNGFHEVTTEIKSKTLQLLLYFTY